jgi:hypothetical protein
MTNFINNSPFLRTTREFPEESSHQLAHEINKAYLDIAGFVNARTIGLFPTTRPAIGGESWFITRNMRQQNLRQVYTFTAAGNITHGINFTSVSQITKPTGSFTDGTNWYGCFYASNVAIAGQVTFFITPTVITVLADAAAPTIVNGNIVIEWITNA